MTWDGRDSTGFSPGFFSVLQILLVPTKKACGSSMAQNLWRMISWWIFHGWIRRFWWYVLLMPLYVMCRQLRCLWTDGLGGLQFQTLGQAFACGRNDPCPGCDLEMVARSICSGMHQGFFVGWWLVGKSVALWNHNSVVKCMWSQENFAIPTFES